MLQASDDFEVFNDQAWVFPTEWNNWNYVQTVDRPNMGLFLLDSETPLPYGSQTYDDLAVQARLWVELGEGAINLRYDSVTHDAYSATLSADGDVALYRSGILIDSASVENITYGPPWHTVRLEALGDDLAANISVAVDGETLIEWIDTDPLPAGTIAFSAIDLSGVGVFVDDFELWVPEDEVVVLGPVTPNPLTVPAADEPNEPHGLLRPAQPETVASTNDVTTLDSPIVFQKDREEEGATDIYLLESGSETPLQLTNDLAHDGHPALSPAGSTLAYSRWENGCTNIYLMDVETGVSELLTDAGLGAYCHNDQPTWSPDGTQLAFVTRPKGGRSSIFVANIDGTGGYSLANDQYIDQAPAWSPDGTQLAFVSYRAARLPGGETGYPGTFIMDANDTAGTSIRQVGDVFDVEPDWSPDGTQLVVSNTVWTGGLLRLIDVSTGVGTPLAVRGRHPTWTPDGEYLVYSASNPITLEPEVRRTRPDGSGEVSVPNTDKAAFPRLKKWQQEPVVCNGFVHSSEEPHKVTLRNYPSVSTGVPLGDLPNGTEVILHGSWLAEAEDGYYWWRVSLADEPTREGWIRHDLVWGPDGDYTYTGIYGVPGVDLRVVEDRCQTVSLDAQTVDPPPPPGACLIQIREGSQATIFSGVSYEVAEYYDNDIDLGANRTIIGDENGEEEIEFRVYARSIEPGGTQYLISPLNVLPQNWVDKSLFERVEGVPPRACDTGTVGTTRTTGQLRSQLGQIGYEEAYLNILWNYATNFQAPVDHLIYENYSSVNIVEREDPMIIPDGIDGVYEAYRISQYAAYYGTHRAIDLTYKPPTGVNSDRSVPFHVYAPFDGVVVDSGPDSITQTIMLEGPRANLPGWIRAECAQEFSDQKTCLPTNSYLFWVELDRSDPDRVHIVFALNRNEDFNDENDDMETMNNGVTLSTLDHGRAQDLISLSDFSVECQGFNQRTYGCSSGSGRQLIIWHDTNSDGQPDIQTLYYHLDVGDSYSTLRNNCSIKGAASMTSREAIWDSGFSECRVLQQELLGSTERIGFTTGIHLHYEVFVDRPHEDNGEDENIFLYESGDDLGEQIDPMLAVDMHMPPGRLN